LFSKIFPILTPLIAITKITGAPDFGGASHELTREGLMLQDGAPQVLAASDLEILR